MLSSVRPILRAIGATIVPEAADLDENGWLVVERIINDALAPRPSSLQRQIRLFVHLIEWAPVPRYGKRFTRLAASRRTAVLTSLQNARLFPLRRGLWGLRTLILMGYYGRPEAAREVGYRASPAGWEARR